MAKTKRRFKEIPKWKTQQSLRKKRRSKARKEAKGKRKVNSFCRDVLAELNQVSYPNEGNAELCKARVDSGMKCWCADHCHCRVCQHEKYLNDRQRCDQAIYECPPACMQCSNHKPCWRW